MHQSNNKFQHRYSESNIHTPLPENIDVRGAANAKKVNTFIYYLLILVVTVLANEVLKTNRKLLILSKFKFQFDFDLKHLVGGKKGKMTR